MNPHIRSITREEHLAFVACRPSVSHMQVPSWGEVKPDWRAESIGWFEPDSTGRAQLAGAALVLHRPIPRTKRTLAYLPEGPVIDWRDPDLGRWLKPMLAYLKAGGAFAVRMGPPVVARYWDAGTVKEAVADPAVRRLRDVPADADDPRAAALVDRLRALGWRRGEEDGQDGFALGQPRYVFQVPLAGRSLEEIRGGLNQQWRRNIKKAEKAGVKVVEGGYEDLAVFYELYRETAVRDRFLPRPLDYFQRMWTALRAEDSDRMRLYLAQHEGETLAAATMLTVGDHVWYSYGASTARKREVQPGNAIQWRMLNDAHERGAAVYDLRGITDTLDEGDHLLGLLRFKTGTGGRAAEYVGEWDYPVNKLLHRAFTLYMARR